MDRLERIRRNINKIHWTIRWIIGLVICVIWIVIGLLMIPVITFWDNSETFKDAISIYFDGIWVLPVVFVYCNSVSINYYTTNPKYTMWLKENIWRYRYFLLNDEIMFLHDHDAMAFKLRWG